MAADSGAIRRPSSQNFVTRCCYLIRKFNLNLTVTIQKPDTQIPEISENLEFFMSSFQMAVPFANRTAFSHLNTGLVGYSDSSCILLLKYDHLNTRHYGFN